MRSSCQEFVRRRSCGNKSRHLASGCDDGNACGPSALRAICYLFIIRWAHVTPALECRHRNSLLLASPPPPPLATAAAAAAAAAPCSFPLTELKSRVGSHGRDSGGARELMN